MDVLYGSPSPLIFLAGLSRNATDFCYDDERAGCWQSGAFEEALYTHTHTDTLVYSTHTTPHTHSPHPAHTHTLYSRYILQLPHTYSVCMLHPAHTHAHTHSHAHPWPPAPRKPHGGHVGQDTLPSSLAMEAALYTLSSHHFQLQNLHWHHYPHLDALSQT